MLLKTPNLKH